MYVYTHLYMHIRVCVCVCAGPHGVPAARCGTSQQQKSSGVCVIVLTGQVQSCVPCLQCEGCVLNYTTVSTRNTCIHTQHVVYMEVPGKVKGHRSHHV